MIREVALAFVGTTATCALLFAMRDLHPLLAQNLHAILALIFWFLPLWLLERAGRDPKAYGLRIRPLGRHLAWALGAMALVFPPFFVGFYIYYKAICATAQPLLCARFVPPWSGGGLHLPPGFAGAALAQLVVIGLPEEWFFRGYLQGRLREQLPPWKAIGMGSLLFALGHYLVDFRPARLAVFFPGLLFGLLRERTGSIVPGAIFHAACNLYMDMLYRSFFLP